MPTQIDSLLEKARLTVDPEEKNKTIKEINRLVKIERQKRANDLIMVHSILDEDHVIVWDKSGANLRYLVPSRTRDIGEGAGNKTVPRYIAIKFLREAITKRVTTDSAKDMNRKIKKYTGNWAAGFVEQNAIRTNNPRLWEKYASEIWLGLVKKYGEEFYETEDEKVVGIQNLEEDVLKKLKLEDRVVETKKNEIIKEAEDGN